MEELSDSREVLAETPHRFMAWFIYLLIAIILTALVWAFVGNIDYYVKVQGEVRPGEVVSNIRNTVTGRVKESYLEEGKSVHKGDLLFAMDVDMQLETSEILERQFDTVGREIKNLEKYRTCIIEGKNLFDADKPEESDYYYRYQKYVTDRDVSAEQVKNTNLDFEKLISDAQLSSETAQNNKTRISHEIDTLHLLLQSVDSNTNLIPKEDVRQHDSFVDYQLNMKRYADLLAQQDTRRKRAEALFAVGGVSKKEKETALYEWQSTALERDTYQNKFRLNINQSLEELEKNREDLSASIKSANAVFSSYSGRGYNAALTAEKSKLDALTGISDTLFTLQNNSDSLQKDLGNIRLSIAEARVISPIDGVINLLTEISVGDYLQSGTEIATIIPGTSGELKIILAVPNADIADIHENQTVHYRFSALPYNEYGELDGAITNISTDVRTDSNSGQSYYLVEAQLPDTVLYGRNQEPASIKVGMALEARVITKNVKIIHWVLEKLNFIDG
jgi:HlyD family secretion protein